MKELAQKIYLLVLLQITNPQGFWDLYSNKKVTQKELIENLLFPLFAAVVFSIFFGEFFRSDYFRLWLGLLWIIREFVLVVALYYFGVVGTNKVLEHYGFGQNQKDLQVLVSYSLVPFLAVSMVSGLFPYFRFLDIAGMYGFYIFWLGSKKLLRFPVEKHDNFVLKIVAANWIVFVLLSYLTATLLKILD
jgi:hypothetical protein